MATISRRTLLIIATLSSIYFTSNGVTADLEDLPEFPTLDLSTVPDLTKKKYTDYGYDIATSYLIYQKLKFASDEYSIVAFISALRFPLAVNVGGKHVMIKGTMEISKNWEALHKVIERGIGKTPFLDAFLSAEGIMFGDGEIWITAECKSGSCDPKSLAVTTINEAP